MVKCWEKYREVENLTKSLGGALVWGGGGFLSEAGLREGAQAEGRVFGAG